MKAKEGLVLLVWFGAQIALVSACGTDSSSGGAAGSRTQTKSTRPAEVVDGHASVLATSTGGDPAACPAGYKACSDGGCCPSNGACSDGFTCDVAPTACSACVNTYSGGRCCDGNCCPSGSTCSSGICQTKRVAAPLPCEGTATAPCGTGCCPAGAACNGEVCEIHGGTPPECAAGSELCDNGSCCPAGYQCSVAGGSYPCERAPLPPAVSTTSGTCTAGDTLVIPTGGNCPARTASNSSYLYARCCPAGSTLYCQDPTATSDPRPTCLKPPLQRVGSCPAGTTDVISSTGSTYVCCPYVDSYPYVADVDGDGQDDCYYEYPATPTCTSGGIDPATGKCCSGSVSSSGCCPSGTWACGDGCCDSADSCSDGMCSTYTSETPTCPVDSARRCPQSDGSTTCCPLDTTCGQNGTCSCPLSANVDCGGFCATDPTACGCPEDHPELCGGSCCLAGGCNRFGAGISDASCGCPSNAASCGGDVCCPQGTTCGSAQGISGCFKCPDDAPMLCGQNCCALDEQCVDGDCVRCPESTPVICGSTCCGLNEICSNGACTSGGSTGGATTCSPLVQACAACSYRVCTTGTSSGDCNAYLETDSGASFSCSSCSGCTDMIQQLIESCCATSQ